MRYITSKNNLNILIKLVFILVLFVVGITSVNAETISFNSHGGSDVNSETRDIGDELDPLPTPTRSGYTFDGWYKDSNYKYKVSNMTIVDGPMELHAKWINIPFPYVYGPYYDEFICTGSNYINTNVALYDNTNWKKDYEIGFTITEYNPTQNTKQAVFMNEKLENSSMKWPGIVFRRFNTENKLEITQSINTGLRESHELENYSIPLKVTIKRINKIVYYSLDDGEDIYLQDMTDFNQQFSVSTYFCAGDNGSGGTQRFLKGTIDDYYIKMGTYEERVDYSVTFPDGTVEVHEKNSEIDLGTNSSSKASEPIEVTFNPHNGESNIISYGYKDYSHNGFKIGDTHYDDGSNLFVEDNTVIEYDYDKTVRPVTFPNDPELDYYIFDGWYTAATGGTKVTEYLGDEDIELHAQYIPGFDDELESVLYVVADKGNTKVVSNIEQGTLISEFKDNMDNPDEYIRVYDSNDNEVSDNSIVKTGLTIKLIVGNNTYDEATMIVEGDINEDGFVNIIDRSLLNDHIQRVSDITGHNFYAADVVKDNTLSLLDKYEMADYILEIINSFNQ